MKSHLIAILLVGIIFFFVGVFASAAIIKEAVRESVFQAFDYYISENGYEEVD